ncbi:MAG: bifunctional 4-hydroxy-2-oxoglutarate aldolase/2-dehydro-3-deoxy-phosphogluconate aldolase [Clostridia bacterium]|nr:bifunctional 4-hydroxy-2-oxoglutarate aldolase/2-dehydro-3-deoxy-phosphogluconate aldolase [Clostridia bacterium]
MEAIEIIKSYKLVPVVQIKKLEDTLPTMGALLSGGLPIAEITFRTECAPEALRLACGKFPDMLIGAGTVISSQQAKVAIDAGASFIVSPGFSPKIAELCANERIPYVPGCVTPTEITAALEYGITLVKFFPAENYGGLDTIKALSAPFKDVLFLPTGGINEKNLLTYLSFPKVAAIGGSFMMKGSYDEIALKCKAAINLVKSLDENPTVL